MFDTGNAAARDVPAMRSNDETWANPFSPVTTLSAHPRGNKRDSTRFDTASVMLVMHMTSNRFQSFLCTPTWCKGVPPDRATYRARKKKTPAVAGVGESVRGVRAGECMDQNVTLQLLM